MDRERVIALVESEIMRKVNTAKLYGEPEYSQYVEVADALTAALNAYKREDRG